MSKLMVGLFRSLLQSSPSAGGGARVGERGRGERGRGIEKRGREGEREGRSRGLQEDKNETQGRSESFLASSKSIGKLI